MSLTKIMLSTACFISLSTCFLDAAAVIFNSKSLYNDNSQRSFRRPAETSETTYYQAPTTYYPNTQATSSYGSGAYPYPMQTYGETYYPSNPGALTYPPAY